MDVLKEALFSPIFFIFITILAVFIGKVIEGLAKNPIVNRFIIALILLLLFVTLTGTSYEEYSKGGNIISIFMGPATVALAIPLYSQLHMLKKHKTVVLLSIFVGCVVCFFSVFFAVKLFGFGQDIYLSTLPKSVTTPVALLLSENIGGIGALTMMSVVIAGITGAAILPSLAKLFRIKEKVALGLAIGTASHVLGTAKALDIGEVEGAFSSLAVSVASVFTVILVPILMQFVQF